MSRPTGPAGRDHDLAELLLLFGLGTVLAVSVAVYGALQLCALVTRRPLEVGVAETPGIVVSWVLGLFADRPPVEVAPGALPASAGVVQAVAVVLFALGLSAVVLVVSACSRGVRTRPGQRADKDAARWATLWGLRSLIVRPGQHAGRLVVGRGPWRRLLAVEERHSLFVLGPTQSRKTSGLAIPALLEWDGSAMATSVKADLMNETIRRRQQLGRVWVFNPAGVPGVPSHGWNPLDSCTS
jgi:type IV secretory pathway TraG/TraD family ATPase VirD4